jgi:FeS assembly SUF system protein
MTPPNDDAAEQGMGGVMPTYDAFGPVAEGLVARAGEARAAEAPPVPSQEAVVEALRTVYDPEIPVNIYELGLIYDIEIAGDGAVKIVMTLTTPGCPVAGILPQQVGDAAAMVPGLGEVEVFLVWDPPWSMERMSEEARLALGMF